MKSQTGDIETGLGQHRPDVVSVMADQMADRKVIVLEEPPEPVFERMLDGKLGIDEYLMGGS